MISDLNLIKKDIPAELLDDEGFKQISGITEMLPANLSIFWGLECRLGSPVPKADVLFEIKKETGGIEILSGTKASCLDRLCTETPVWQRLRNFAAQWENPTCPFHSWIKNIWLEFDTEKTTKLNEAKQLIVEPSLFVGIRSKELSQNELDVVFRQALKVFTQPPENLKVIQQFAESIPKKSQIFQYGAMLGRPTRDTRVCVSHLNLHDVSDWLKKINWPGDTDKLNDILNKIAPFTHASAVDLDISQHGPAGKIGIEIYLDWHNHNPEQWLPIMDLFANMELCNPAKIKGLLEYPGISKISHSAHNRSTDQKLALSLFRIIHHLKLTFNHDKTEEIKAYLAVYKPYIDLKEGWVQI